MANFKHHNVGLDFRDALRDEPAGCASNVLAGVMLFATRLRAAPRMCWQACLVKISKKLEARPRRSLSTKYCFFAEDAEEEEGRWVQARAWARTNSPLAPALQSSCADHQPPMSMPNCLLDAVDALQLARAKGRGLEGRGRLEHTSARGCASPRRACEIPSKSADREELRRSDFNSIFKHFILFDRGYNLFVKK